MATVKLNNVTWNDVDTVVNANGLTATEAADSIEGAKNGNIGNTPFNSGTDLNTGFLPDGCSFQFVTGFTNGPSGS